MRDQIKAVLLKSEGWSKLSDKQSQQIKTHLDRITYTRVLDICAYVQCRFGLHYTVSGMTKWLKHA